MQPLAKRNGNGNGNGNGNATGLPRSLSYFKSPDHFNLLLPPSPSPRLKSASDEPLHEHNHCRTATILTGRVGSRPASDTFDCVRNQGVKAAQMGKDATSRQTASNAELETLLHSLLSTVCQSPEERGARPDMAARTTIVGEPTTTGLAQAAAHQLGTPLHQSAGLNGAQTPDSRCKLEATSRDGTDCIGLNAASFFANRNSKQPPTNAIRSTSESLQAPSDARQCSDWPERTRARSCSTNRINQPVFVLENGYAKRRASCSSPDYSDVNSRQAASASAAAAETNLRALQQQQRMDLANGASTACTVTVTNARAPVPVDTCADQLCFQQKTQQIQMCVESTRRPASAPATTTLAASFFVKATEKLSRSSKPSAGPMQKAAKKVKKQLNGANQLAATQTDVDCRASLSQARLPLTVWRTKFSDVLRCNPPPLPQLTNCSQKVKVLLRIADGPSAAAHPSTCLAELSAFNQAPPLIAVDPKRTYVTVNESVLSNEYVAPSQRRQLPPKVFPFDAVFTKDDPLPNLCACALGDIVEAVVNGVDGCVVCYGSGKLGKTSTLIGNDANAGSLGMIPCAIAWLFKLINDHKEKSNARFSVRVSAIEISGENETVRDLLSEIAESSDLVSSTAPVAYLRARGDGDAVGSNEMENSELRAPSAEKAAYYLDTALQARAKHDSEDATRMDHFIFTLHVYQYRVEKQEVSGGHSKLHLLDLGLGSRSREAPTAMTSAAICNVMLGLLNGQRHIAHRESRLTQVLRDSLSLTCLCTIVAHVSSQIQHYSESMNALQFAQRLLRLQRRRNKIHKASSDGSNSSCDSYGVRRGRPRLMMGTGGLMRPRFTSNALSQSEPDGGCTSSSEQSGDTVIYMGNGAQYHVTETTDTDTDAGTVVMRSQANQRPEIKRSRSASLGPRPRRASNVRTPSAERWINGPSPASTDYNQSQSLATNGEVISTGRPLFQGMEEVWIDGPREFQCSSHTASANATLDSTNCACPSPSQPTISNELPSSTKQNSPVQPPQVASHTIQSPKSQSTDQLAVDISDKHTGTGDEPECNSNTSSCSASVEDVRGARALSDISEHTEQTQPDDGDSHSDGSYPELPVVFPEMLHGLGHAHSTAAPSKQVTKAREFVSAWIDKQAEMSRGVESSLGAKLDQRAQIKQDAKPAACATPKRDKEPLKVHTDQVPPTPPPLPPLLTPQARAREQDERSESIVEADDECDLPCNSLRAKKLDITKTTQNNTHREDDLVSSILDLAAQPPDLAALQPNAEQPNSSTAFQHPGLNNLERVAQWLQNLSTMPPSQTISPTNSVTQSSTKSTANANEPRQPTNNSHIPNASTPSLPTPTSDAFKAAVVALSLNSSRPASGATNVSQPAPTAPANPLLNNVAQPQSQAQPLQPELANGNLPTDPTSLVAAQPCKQNVFVASAGVKQTTLNQHQHTQSSASAHLTVAQPSPDAAMHSRVQSMTNPSVLQHPQAVSLAAAVAQVEPAAPFSQTAQQTLMVASMHSQAHAQVQMQMHLAQHAHSRTSLQPQPQPQPQRAFSTVSSDTATKPETRDIDVQTLTVNDVVWLSRLANPSILAPASCLSPCYTSMAKSMPKSPKSAKSLLKCMLFAKHSNVHAARGTKSGSILCVRRSGSIEDTSLRCRLADSTCSDHSPSAAVFSDSGSARRRSSSTAKDAKRKGFLSSPFAHKSKGASSQLSRRLNIESASDFTPSRQAPQLAAHLQGAAPGIHAMHLLENFRSDACSPTTYYPQWHASHLTTTAQSAANFCPSPVFANTRIMVPPSANHTLSTFALSSGHMSDSSACGVSPATMYNARMEGYTFLAHGYGASNRHRYRRIPVARNDFGRSTNAGTSSGYESMIRDSEATTGSSSHNDSTSESSIADGISPTSRSGFAGANGMTRSSSAPPPKMMSYSLGLLNAPHSRRVPQQQPQIGVQSPQDMRSWNATSSLATAGLNSCIEPRLVQNLHISRANSEVEAPRLSHFQNASRHPPHSVTFCESVASVQRQPSAGSVGHQVLQYEADDIERIQRSRNQHITREIFERQRVQEIRYLLQKQCLLKRELYEAKNRLQADPTSWSYDLHVAEETDRRDPGFLEALRKETEILEKRVKACKSHVMLTTCFDSCAS